MITLNVTLDEDVPATHAQVAQAVGDFLHRQYSSGSTIVSSDQGLTGPASTVTPAPSTNVAEEGTCDNCLKRIYLSKTGVHTWKWVTDPRRRQTWHCGSDPAKPVLAHSPVQWVKPRGETL